MGLTANGENGVKALIKSRYKHAARTYPSLGEVRKATGSARERVVVALDGNVLMMQVPRSAASFAAYAGIVTSAVRQAMGSAQIVAVVFDDPKYMTGAKREEQLKRDANRKKKTPICSSDVIPHPTSDDYGVAELTSIADCHAIVGCRAARQRFFDEVGRHIMLNLQRTINTWAESGAESVVIFDGLDQRGATRPIGEPRDTQIFGSDPDVAALFWRNEPIGEGDLKLAWIEERVRLLAAQGRLSTNLHITCTIDTDSIAIELMEQARRNCLPEPEHAVKGALCMRERAAKREEWGDDDSRAVYWVVDYAELLRMIQQDMWGVKSHDLLPTAVEQRAAIALMCGGWALSGCDFCKLPGMRADFVFESVPSMLKTAPELLDIMKASWSGDRAAAKSVTAALRRLVLLCAGNYADQPRARKATVQSMRDHDKCTLLRAAWTVSYWNCHEFSGDLQDFGFSQIYESGAAQNAADPPPRLSVKRALPEVIDLGSDEAGVSTTTGPPKKPEAPGLKVSRFFAQCGEASDAPTQW